MVSSILIWLVVGALIGLVCHERDPWRVTWRYTLASVLGATMLGALMHWRITGGGYEGATILVGNFFASLLGAGAGMFVLYLGRLFFRR